MNDEINDGGPAFPAPRENRSEGMSLRDWFAGQALAGQSALVDNRRCPRERDGEVEVWRDELRALDAAWCYQMADAMLKARGGEK